MPILGKPRVSAASAHGKAEFADAADTPGFHKIGVLYQPKNFNLFKKNTLMFPSIVCNFLPCCLVDLSLFYSKIKFADAADTPDFSQNRHFMPADKL